MYLLLVSMMRLRMEIPRRSLLLGAITAALASGAIAQTLGNEDPMARGGFDRRDCHMNAIMWLDSNSPNPAYFFGEVDNHPHKMLYLTMEGCRNFCGEPTAYFDWLARLTIWTIPILLLISNIQLAPVAKKRFATIVHSLGDPIDSLWSMVHKLYVWHRLYEIALEAVMYHEESLRRQSLREPWARVERRAAGETVRKARTIATVLSGFEEVCGAKAETEQFYRDIIDTFYPHGESRAARKRRRKWSAAATALVGGRSNDFLRTMLALLVYYFGIASALVEKLGGGGGTPPGGRIASALFLSWLVPLVLLSNTFGSFTDRRVCIDILLRFLRPVTGELVSHGNSLDDVQYHLVLSWDDYFDSVMWMGAMHTFRPWKALSYRRYNNGTTHSSARNAGLNTALTAAAFFPALVSMLAASLIIWYAVPSGFSCRHAWIIGVSLGWVLSTLLTNSLYFCTRGKIHWWLVFAKDLVVLVCTTVLPMASTVGAFNNCRCWSSDWVSGNGYVAVGIEDAYKDMQDRVYSRIILTSQGLQLAFYFAVILWWRHGIKVVRWSERHIREEWNQDHQSWSLVLAYYLRLIIGHPMARLSMREQLRSAGWRERQMGERDPAIELRPIV